MSAWNHIAGMDHLRRRTEDLIERARGKQNSRSKSSDYRPVSSIARPTDLHQSLSDAPYLGDISGGFDKS